MQPNVIINYSIFICPFESRKCGKEEEKRDFLISGIRKGLFRWNKKTFFIVFEGLSLGEKNKTLIENSEHNL